MAVKTRLEPIDRDIALMLNEALSPAAQSQALAQYAREGIEEARNTNRQILGRLPHETIAVDGRKGAALESVKANGVIIVEFELFNDALIWIADQITIHSPFKTGQFRKNNALFADGREIEVGKEIPAATEFVFINLTPYARKIERGTSSQAPDGVFQAVATLAQRRFGNVARISFSYRTALGGSFLTGRQGDRSQQRNPAIVVTFPR